MYTFLGSVSVLLLPLLRRVAAEASLAPFDPNIVCNGWPSKTYPSHPSWALQLDLPEGYNSSTWATYIDFCSAAFGEVSIDEDTFEASPNNVGCSCDGTDYDSLKCSSTYGNPALLSLQGHCVQQCRCTAQSNADQYRIHGQLSNGQFDLNGNNWGDQVLPWSEVEDWSAVTGYPQYTDPAAPSYALDNERYCGFNKCQKASDCAAFGVCGQQCSTQSHIPGLGPNQTYVYAICQMNISTSSPTLVSTPDLDGRDFNDNLNTEIEQNAVPVSGSQATTANTWGCPCNMTFVHPDCCPLPDGNLPYNGQNTTGTLEAVHGPNGEVAAYQFIATSMKKRDVKQTEAKERRLRHL